LFRWKHSVLLVSYSFHYFLVRSCRTMMRPCSLSLIKQNRYKKRLKLWKYLALCLKFGNSYQTPLSLIDEYKLKVHLFQLNLHLPVWRLTGMPFSRMIGLPHSKFGFFGWLHKTGSSKFSSRDNSSFVNIRSYSQVNLNKTSSTLPPDAISTSSIRTTTFVHQRKKSHRASCIFRLVLKPPR
jgi:hypothetical protein